MLKDFNSKLSKPLSVALGFFDGVHNGHRKLIEIAKSQGYNTAVFTFKGKFFKNSKGSVYTFAEKAELLKNLGVQYVIYAKTTQDFFNMQATEFLQSFISRFNVKTFVCGKDFTFGKNAEGTIETLRDFCLKHDINFIVADTQTYNGVKISSAKIKEFLKDGQIKTANELLGSPYIITGKVLKGRGVGAKSVFSTANLNINKNKIMLKSGVYATKTFYNGVLYNSLTNFGNCPTFNQQKPLIETHLLNFNGNLYGEKIKIYFLDYLREIKTFNNSKELKEQIQKDMGCFND